MVAVARVCSVAGMVHPPNSAKRRQRDRAVDRPDFRSYERLRNEVAWQLSDRVQVKMTQNPKKNILKKLPWSEDLVLVLARDSQPVFF